MHRSLNRRSLLKASGALSLATIVRAYPGARVIHAQGSASYDLVDLGAWDVEVGDKSWGWRGVGFVTDINEAGMMCGGIGVSDERGSPATWSSDGKLKRLKSTKGGGLAQSINRDGDVVGMEYVAEATNRPMLWRKGERIELPPLDDAPDVTHGAANDINGDGVIVGTLTTGETNGARPVRWINEVAEELAAPDGQRASSALYVNDAGTVLGTLQQDEDADDLPTFVLWGHDEVTILPTPDVIDKGSIFFVRAFNNKDAVLISAYGFQTDGQWRHVILQSDETPTVIRRDEGLSLSGEDMNDDGDVVGKIIKDDDVDRGVLWRGDETIDLTDAVSSNTGLRITYPSAINNAGMIAGQALDDDDVIHGVLLVPRD